VRRVALVLLTIDPLPPTSIDPDEVASSTAMIV
jgi:hypothetical protein